MIGRRAVGGALTRCRRNDEGQPDVPTLRARLRAELLVALDIEIALLVADGKMYPSCGPTLNTRERKQPTRSPEPLSQPISW